MGCQSLPSVAAVLVLFTSLGVCQEAGRQFIYPPWPEQEKYAFWDGTDIIVQYECPSGSANLYIWCESPDTGKAITVAPVESGISCKNTEHTVHIDFKYTAEQCWFNLKNPLLATDSTSWQGFNSGHFQLSPDAPDETTDSASETTKATESAAKTTFSAEPTTTDKVTAKSITTKSSTSVSEVKSTESSEADPSESLDASPTESGEAGSTAPSDANDADTASGFDDDDLSMGAKAGIGVGVSIGVLGIVALIGAFCLVRRRSNRVRSEETHELHGDGQKETFKERHQAEHASKDSYGSEQNSGKECQVDESYKEGFSAPATRPNNWLFPSELESGRLRHEMPS